MGFSTLNLSRRTTFCTSDLPRIPKATASATLMRDPKQDGRPATPINRYSRNASEVGPSSSHTPSGSPEIDRTVQLGRQRRDAHKKLISPCLVFDGVFFISVTGQYAGTQVTDVIRIVVAPTRKFGLEYAYGPVGNCLAAVTARAASAHNPVGHQPFGAPREISRTRSPTFCLYLRRTGRQF